MKHGRKLIDWGISNDEELEDFHWDDFLMELDYIVDSKNKGDYWKASVNNFGWRNLDGQKFFKADSSIELLREVLPDTDCHFNIFNFGKGIAIQNYHHDSPMGNEWYYLLPITESTYEKQTA